MFRVQAHAADLMIFGVKDRDLAVLLEQLDLLALQDIVTCPRFLGPL
jgi:hypothetical protein